jgi:hypothetical protein
MNMTRSGLTAFTVELKCRVEVGGSRKADPPQKMDEPEAVEVARRRWWKAVLPVLGLAISEGARQFLEVHHWRWPW